MKWNRCCRIFILILIFGLSVQNLFPKAVSETPLYRFAFICPLKWDLTAEGIAMADSEFHVSTKLYGMQKSSLPHMIEAINEAIYSDVDGIITVGYDTPDFCDALRDAQNAGIPVILLENDLDESLRQGYIGIPNYRAGELAGEDMIEATGGHAKIGIVVSSLEYSSQQDRVDGFYKAIESCPDMEIAETISCYSDRLFILEQVNDLLSRHPDIDALFLAEGCASSLAGEIMKNNNHSGITVIGFDGEYTPHFIRDETYYAAVVGDFSESGYLAVQKLVDYLAGKSITATEYASIYNVTKSNIDTMYQKFSNTGGSYPWHVY